MQPQQEPTLSSSKVLPGLNGTIRRPADGAIRGMTPKVASAQTLPERLTQTEMELERLQGQVQELRREWEQESVSELKNQFDTLREAVLRYSFACAEVEMRLALIRARTDDTPHAAEVLRHSLEEQTAASDELRRLARTLHQAPSSS